MTTKKKLLSVAKAGKLDNQVFKLKVSLDDTTPVVWRRILVPGTFSLEALHSVIQLSMGWQMSHLYDFHIGNERYADPDEFDEKSPRPLATSLNAALKFETSFTYNYDFGDDWHHTITVEEVTSNGDEVRNPVCIDGENACPPEDCGGTPGFEELKKQVEDHKHPEHQGIMRWLGGYYSPYSFDANRINRDLLGSVNWKAGPNDQGLYHPFLLG